jgi:hypothetical protein
MHSAAIRRERSGERSVDAAVPNADTDYPHWVAVDQQRRKLPDEPVLQQRTLIAGRFVLRMGQCVPTVRQSRQRRLVVNRFPKPVQWEVSASHSHEAGFPSS